MAQGPNQQKKWWMGISLVTLGAVAHPTVQQWLRKVLVKTAQGILEVKDEAIEMYALTREELEDIVAEVKYRRRFEKMAVAGSKVTETIHQEPILENAKRSRVQTSPTESEDLQGVDVLLQVHER
ncbi:hypothetical protein [Sulfoacidibacillus thermotolerans]|uniref:Uncharacterized protein n=1 Tax=Sulfoacidibacillus thermotolerans TaxID=1765684 RepID=A0A2U3DAP9_SULT2|nr:hypothetical protein [Sulfoacidibacillus thermotolerans]PWI58333.1 hypothetical protein BM613_03695 [Sulfoacidibacillus thermotolerans]